MSVLSQSAHVSATDAREDRAHARTPALDFTDLVALGQHEERAGHRAAARAAYERALGCIRTVEDAAQVSGIVRWIARTHHTDGDAEAARDCLELALAIAELWADDAAAGHALNVKAVVSWQRGDLDDAERLYLLARSRAVQAGDAKLAAMTAQNLGVLANIRGDFALAEQQYLASLAAYRSLGLTSDICIALNNLGLLHIACERWDKAERVLLEGVQICELSGDPMTRTQLDINLAELWVRRGEYVRAQSAVAKALEVAAQTGDASAVGKATKLLGVIARETGDFEQADRHFVSADEIATARGELLLQAELARERADLARRMGRNRDVLQQLNRSHRLFTILRAQPDLTDVDRRVGELEAEFVHVARRWGESIEAKDRYTQGHCQRVAELACAIAQKSGFDQNALFWFRIGALLHDVGKLVIPQEVLNKPGKLDEAEWQLMRSHCTAGVEMLADIEFPWDVRPMIESHHERWDGRGYPHGLAGEAIPLVARILTIADVYDALTSVRSYKRAHSHDEAMAILRADVGTMFDPRVFAWFEEVAGGWPGRIVHLLHEGVAPAIGTEPAPAPVDDAAARPSSARADVVHGVVTTDDELDDLTRLPMRRAFRVAAEQLLEQRRTTGRPVAMLVIDIDHFKLVNDTFGHQRGDQVLATVASVIRRTVRPVDFVARYAGDEFVVLLPGARLEDACLVAERLREAVCETRYAPEHEDEPTLRITLSIGAACAPLHGETMDAIFGAADSALYGAKRAGRNSVTTAGRAGQGKREMLLDCFVGRSAEHLKLRKLFGDAAAGEPHMVVLRGEAGVGKSALLRQLGPDVAIRGGAVLTGQCIEADISLPYGPLADVIRNAHRAGLVGARPWRALARLVPEVQPENSGDRSRGVAELHSNDGTQRILLEEMLEFLQLASAVRPLVIILDDLQWADPATWDGLEFLLSRLRDHHLLFCLTVRSEDTSECAESRLRRLSRSERCADIALQRLQRGDLQQWLRNTLGGQRPDAALLEYVARQSEGNPFFAVQTLRALVEDGALRIDGDRWEFCTDRIADVPRAIGDLLARRVQRLDRSRREILALAALIGRDFDPTVLATAFAGDESDVHNALDDGLAAAVLVPSPRSRPMLSFTHGLLTRELLQGINPLRIRSMHKRVALALASQPERDLAAIASHFDAADSALDAYPSAMEAGLQARSIYAYETAVEFFRVARRHAHSPRDIAAVEWELAQVEELAGRTPQAEVHCSLLLDRHVEGANELQIVPFVHRMRVRLRMLRGVSAAESLTDCAVLLDQARERGLHEEQLALMIMMSTLHQRMGAIEEAERFAREAVAAADELPTAALIADAVMRLGSVLIAVSPASAVPHYRRALDIFTRIGDRIGQIRCHINIGSASDRAGNHAGAEGSYLTALKLARDIHASDFIGVTLLNLGVLSLRIGQLDESRARCAEALAIFNAAGHEPHRLAALYNLAHIARAEGKSAQALALYDNCAELAAQIAQIDVQIGALAGAGLTELDQRAFAAAEARFTHVRQLLQHKDDWWFQGRELAEALAVRLAATAGHTHTAPDTLRGGIELLIAGLRRAERHDAYHALWLGAECAGLFSVARQLPDLAHVAAVHCKLRDQAIALGYSYLADRLELSTAVDDADSLYGDGLAVPGEPRIEVHQSRVQLTRARDIT